MREEIKIPQMGESVTEASIGNILKPTGSYVQENEEILELETEKVNQVLYAPKSGVVFWNVEEGKTVFIGDVIGYVDTEKQATAQPPPSPSPKKVEAEPQKTVEQKPSTERVRMMQEEFVSELKKPAKEIVKEEKLPVETKEIPSPVEGKKETRKPLSKIRKTIAARLVSSLHNSAMLTTFNEVDMSAILEMRQKHKEKFLEKFEVKLGLMSFFVKATVEALKAFPHFNSYIEGDFIVHRGYYDIGIAVGSERGLVVPVVRHCDQLSFAEIEAAIAHYAKKAHEGSLSIPDLEGGSFTLTNGGVYGSLLSTPILNPPQVGILGMHKITKRPCVIDDAIVIRPLMYLALSYDHRLIDGREAVFFLVKIKEILEDPSRLLLMDEDEKEDV